MRDEFGSKKKLSNDCLSRKENFYAANLMTKKIKIRQDHSLRERDQMRKILDPMAAVYLLIFFCLDHCVYLTEESQP